MKGLKNKDSNHKQSGMSLIETVPIIMAVALLLAFLLGGWGMIHKNILHSIAARNYAFETFGNRSNLIYFSDIRSEENSYAKTGLRYHSIGKNKPTYFSAFTVPIKFPLQAAKNTGPNSLHISRIWSDSGLTEGREFTPSGIENLTHSWVMVGYGMCLDSNCGSN